MARIQKTWMHIRMDGCHHVPLLLNKGLFFHYFLNILNRGPYSVIILPRQTDRQRFQGNKNLQQSTHTVHKDYK